MLGSVSNVIFVSDPLTTGFKNLCDGASWIELSEISLAG